MNKLIAIFSSLLVFAAGVAAAEDKPWTRPTLELNSHTSVMINAPAAKLWPHILDASEWKQGLILIPVEGELGQPGAIHKAVDRTEGKTALYYVKDVEVVPNERRTYKFYQPNLGPLMGYASFQLGPSGSQTKVSYHVYSEAFIPSDLLAQTTVGETAVYQEKYFADNHARFQAQLAALKALVEG